MKLLKDAHIKGRKVFLRVDFNVPIVDGEIEDDNRIAAVLPTIKHILHHGGKIIIGSHLGRPEGKNNPEFSLWLVANRLARLLGIKTNFTEPAPSYKLNDQISLLENLRFDSREEENNSEYAEMLAGKTRSEDSDLGIYVNDAFAVSHRANASVDAITKFLPSYAGLLMEKEIENLGKIKENPELPFVVVIGGVKVKDKAGVIEELASKADKILLGGGVANTFLRARGDNVGNSVFDEEMVERCKEMLERYDGKLELPIDYVKEYDEQKREKILDIGAQTRTNFANEIRAAKTVFWNGSLGYSENEKYRGGMRSIAKAMSEVEGFTVIAGGDTVGFVKSESLDKHISFLSTGGGAALEFLAGKRLPGLVVLNESTN